MKRVDKAIIVSNKRKMKNWFFDGVGQLFMMAIRVSLTVLRSIT